MNPSSSAPSTSRALTIPDVRIQYNQTTYGRVRRIAHNNPKCTKVALVTGSIGVATIFNLGAMLYTILFLGVPLLIITAAVTHGCRNGHPPIKTLGHIKTVASSALTYIIPANHVMSTHIFTEMKILNCALTYEGDIPVLTLRGSPETCGRAQGYLLAEQIQSFLKIWGSILWTVIPDKNKAKELCDHLKTQIPVAILDEMEGLVRGYNYAMLTLGQKDRITVDDILLLHLVPDCEHTLPMTLAKKFIPPIGCTVVIDKGDQATGLVFGRNMDWPSLGIAGQASLLVRRIHDSGKITHEIAIPGLVGTLTGMSNRGFTIAMNVALGKTENYKTGLPAIILNRILLENSDTVEDVLNQIKTLRPIGPYHLNVAEPSGKATSIHFYQDAGNKDCIRKLGNEPLVTTNCSYSFLGRYKPYFNSEERLANIRLVYANRNSSAEEKVIESLNAPEVKNHETVHTVIMLPAKGIMKIAFNNAYAGDNPMHTIEFPTFTG